VKATFKPLSLFCCIVFFVTIKTIAQVKVSGTVDDSTGIHPLEAVSVLSVFGKGTVTDANGHFEISVIEKDSIWFSYLNKPTIKFPVIEIMNYPQFDISLKVSVPVLKEVKIWAWDYRLDSIQNRIDYAKVFKYKKPTFKSIVTSIGLGFTIDVDELIRTFEYKKIQNTLNFKNRLLQQEKDKFIDHRFNKLVVRRLTRLEGNELDSFMLIYRPQYEFVLYASDYDFQEYIMEAYKKYSG
jgi:hypothetical protein